MATDHDERIKALALDAAGQVAKLEFCGKRWTRDVVTATDIIADAIRTALGETRPGAGEQIDLLATFILEEVDGHPRHSEGAGDCAVRIIRDLTTQLVVERETLEMQQKEIADHKYWRETACKHADKCEAQLAVAREALEWIDCYGGGSSVEPIYKAREALAKMDKAES